jgi:acetone carboxylase gamma subunit
MISDVLFDASEAIKECLAGLTTGKKYDDIVGPIRKIVTLLDSARLVLDSPPTGKSEADYEAFWKSIAALDIRPVEAALKKFVPTSGRSSPPPKRPVA